MGRDEGSWERFEQFREEIGDDGERREERCLEAERRSVGEVGGRRRGESEEGDDGGDGGDLSGGGGVRVAWRSRERESQLEVKERLKSVDVPAELIGNLRVRTPFRDERKGSTDDA